MKEKMITRTIVNTIATVKGANIFENTIESKEISLVGSFKNNDEIMAVIKEMGFDNTFVPVMIEKTEEHEKLYGMSETMFLQYAKELPPRKIYE